MAVYTQLTFEQIATFLREQYDIGALATADGIAQGVENSNYLLALQNGTRYILTLYEKRVNPAELPFFLNLMQHVARGGVACPAPVMRRDGALYGTVAGKQAALISFLPGKSRTSWSVDQVTKVGTVLGQLHQAAADFSGARVNDLSLSGWQQLYRKTTGKLDSITPGLETLIETELQMLQQNWPAALQQNGVIHADLFPDNVFFEGDNVSGLIDFYFACNDALAYDIAITINAWCFEENGDFNADKSAALLRGYQQIRALTAAEKSALPILLRGAALRFLLTRAHDWIYRADGALVTPHDPREYMRKLQFHRTVTDGSIYGAN